LLLITHDVYLAEGVADRLWLVHDGRASPYDGRLSDYRELVFSPDRPLDHAERERRAPPKPAPAEKRPSAYTLKQRLAASAVLEAARP
jgi:ATP-binding cassette subfamily F protein 3